MGGDIYVDVCYRECKVACWNPRQVRAREIAERCIQGGHLRIQERQCRVVVRGSGSGFHFHLVAIGLQLLHSLSRVPLICKARLTHHLPHKTVMRIQCDKAQKTRGPMNGTQETLNQC